MQEIIVCDQVKFNFDGTLQTVFLPWVPTIYQEVELKATGGSKFLLAQSQLSRCIICFWISWRHWKLLFYIGCAKASSDYKWFSSDTSIVYISASGILQAKKPGKATVRVVSVFDSANYDEVMILWQRICSFILDKLKSFLFLIWTIEK